MSELRPDHRRPSSASSGSTAERPLSCRLHSIGQSELVEREGIVGMFAGEGTSERWTSFAVLRAELRVRPGRSPPRRSVTVHVEFAL